jgi:hypothetical protein
VKSLNETYLTIFLIQVSNEFLIQKSLNFCLLTFVTYDALRCVYILNYLASLQQAAIFCLSYNIQRIKIFLFYFKAKKI